MSVVSETTLDAKVPSGPIEDKWEKHRFDMKLVAPNNKRKFDIVVVGTGLAGASAEPVYSGLPPPRPQYCRPGGHQCRQKLSQRRR